MLQIGTIKSNATYCLLISTYLSISSFWSSMHYMRASGAPPVLLSLHYPVSSMRFTHSTDEHRMLSENPLHSPASSAKLIRTAEASLVYASFPGFLRKSDLGSGSSQAHVSLPGFLHGANERKSLAGHEAHHSSSRCTDVINIRRIDKSVRGTDRITATHYTVSRGVSNCFPQH